MNRETQRRPSLWVSIFRGLDLSRRVVLNLVFFLLLFAFLAAAAGDVPIVPGEAALVLQPGGILVEQLAGDPVDRAIDKATDSYVPETLVGDLVDAITAARDDERIQAIYLDVSGLLGGGLDKAIRVASALEDFRAAGKNVIATADFYEKTGYLIATAADEVYLHDQGILFLDGYSRFRTYYRDGIERLEIDWNVFKVGDYKSAVEPYLRNDMSDEARQANLEFLGDLWSAYLDRVAASREVERTEVETALAEMVARLEQADGDLARVALDSGLVDELTSRPRVRERMVELVGESEDGTTFSQIAMDDYLTAIAEGRNRYPSEGEGIGVIVAKGTILDGSQPPGSVGGDSTAWLIRKAREDASVKALVLRVDSPGGSAFASEVIRRELQMLRDAGKPVVVSMGSLAASGGYWISTASDEIWANPATITGSIGIYGMFPTFQKPMAEYLGMHVDGVGTTWLGGAIRPDRALDDRVAAMFRMTIEKGYRDF
ncbi:MAG: signal peptide peptidase SppA, partial [Holophagales bacterium]|nr:signal peptide peptidase SppA [Holophagales bacterium]